VCPNSRYMNTLLRLRLVLACCMALGLSTIAAFGQAATSPNSATDQTTAGQTTTANRGDQDNHSNWGWIGLAGLLGLAGLMKRRDATEYNRVDRADTRREARV